MDPTKHKHEIDRSEPTQERSEFPGLEEQIVPVEREPEPEKPRLPIENIISGEDLDENDLPGSEKPKYIQ